MSILSANSIDVSRGEVPILSDTSFSIGKGELVGLIGPNGAGKTTLLRALTGLLPVQKGSISFDGTVLERKDRTQLAQKVAYLEQNSRSFWPLAVENLVMLGRMPHLGQWQRPSNSDWEVVYQAMATCDVLQFSSRAVTNLSGGEQARVMLARTLATEPEILLADEPVSGLDPAHQLDVMDKLRELVKGNAGVVVVMHDLTLASRYCDRLTLMFEGKVAAEGDIETVLSSETLMRCYGIEAHFGMMPEGMFVVPKRRVQPQ